MTFRDACKEAMKRTGWTDQEIADQIRAADIKFPGAIETGNQVVVPGHEETLIEQLIHMYTTVKNNPVLLAQVKGWLKDQDEKAQTSN